MAKKLYVRFSTAQDEKAVFDFYNENRHTFVFQRDPEVWKERIASGAVTMVEDEQGKIVAAAISYPVMDKDANGNDVHQWTEIGSVRVALDGIGLAKPLVSAQVLRAYLFEPPDNRFLIEIDVANSHSRHVFTAKLGATPFDMTPELERKVTSTVVPGSASDPVDWFQMGVETIPALARNILEAQQNPVVKDRKTGQEYELDFSRCVLATMFQKELQDLALQDFGDVAKPDPRHGINHFKAKFNP